MSIFICSMCGGYKDSDDGCDEYLDNLYCRDCVDDMSMRVDAMYYGESFEELLKEDQ